MSNQSGVLYVIATPIGNLGDISSRAGQILTEVDLILAEDTRHSRKLLDYLGIVTPVKSYHDHNERESITGLLELLQTGKNLGLICDAGTPLIRDPGFHLVHAAHEEGIRVIPVPGVSALIAALSVAGLATDKFMFEGYLPDKQAARRKYLQTLASVSRTMVFYEAPHRIKNFLTDTITIFGENRRAVIAREITKKFETIRKDTLTGLLTWIASDANQQKGEFVIIIEGNHGEDQPQEQEVIRLIEILLSHSLPVKEAAAIAAEITGERKNKLYQLALKLQPQA